MSWMRNDTRALLRKDGAWLLVFFVLGLVAAGCGLERGFALVFVFPRDFTELQAVLQVGAWLLGLACALREDLTGTRDFLRHRAVSPARAFWTRALAGTAVYLAWTAGAAAFLWLHELVFGMGGACADPRRLLALIEQVAFGLATFALVLCAFTLPVGWWSRAFLAATSWMALVALSSLVPALELSTAASTVLWLALAGAALYGAWVGERTRPDPDRPRPRSALVPLVPLLAAGASLFGVFSVAFWQASSLRSLKDTRPYVVLASSGELELVSPRSRRGEHPILTSEGRPSGSTIRWTSELPYEVPPRTAGPGLRPFLERPWPHGREQTWVRNASREVWVEGGAIRVVDSDADEVPNGTRRCWNVAPPLGGPLSPQASFRDFRHGESVELLLTDPQHPSAGGPWLLTQDSPPALVAIPLPDGERLVSFGYDSQLDGARFGLARGERGRYRRGAQGWQAIEAPPAEKNKARLTREVLDLDPLRPEVEVRGPDGQVLRHRYRLATLQAKLLAASTGLATVLRPLPSALLSATLDYEDVALRRLDEVLPLVDPLIGGGYAWLLGGNLLLHVGLVFLTRRSLRQLGASPRRILGWSAAVLLAGVFAGPVLAAFETRRAWRRSRLAQPAPPRIRAA